MSKYAIQVEGLGKEYIIGGAEQRHESFREMLTSALTSPLRKLRKLGGTASEEERFWALKDVSFNVEQGEVLGIIGRNGAGKSTLLKVLSRITSPTTGRVITRGRVASLLEVGTGFHPELTGRENIYLNGAILGMARLEIDRQFDEIVAFAEIDKFLDTPVKRYSSGMYVRLAFSVAAHLGADVLVVDEVLAVGDLEFQKRCIGKMKDVASTGKTVIFVSHNMGVIQSLCNYGLILRQGQLHCEITPMAQTVEAYLRMGSADKDVQDAFVAAWISASSEFELRSLLICGKEHGQVSLDESDGLLSVDFEFLQQPSHPFELEIRIKDPLGIDIAFGSPTRTSGSAMRCAKNSKASWTFEVPSIRSGYYLLDVCLTIPNNRVLGRLRKPVSLTSEGRIRGSERLFSHKDVGFLLLSEARE